MNVRRMTTILCLASSVLFCTVAGQLLGNDDLPRGAGTAPCDMAGTWLGKFPIENSPYQVPLLVTETLTPLDATGDRLAYVMRMLNSDFTFTGMFPETNLVTDLVGEAVRTGPDTYELRVIGYGVKKPVLDDVAWADRGQVQFIWTLNGSAMCTGGDSLEHELMLALYSGIDNPDFAFPWTPDVPFPLHDQDLDDDGLPDEGEEPIMQVPFSHVSKPAPRPILP